MHVVDACSFDYDDDISSDATIVNGLRFSKRTLKTGHFEIQTGP